MEFLSFENCFCKSAMIPQMNLLSPSSSNGSLLGCFWLRHSCGSAQDSITTDVTTCLWLLIELRWCLVAHYCYFMESSDTRGGRWKRLPFKRQKEQKVWPGWREFQMARLVETKTLSSLTSLQSILREGGAGTVCMKCQPYQSPY